MQVVVRGELSDIRTRLEEQVYDTCEDNGSSLVVLL